MIAFILIIFMILAALVSVYGSVDMFKQLFSKQNRDSLK
jgi:hypothetical protein